MNKKPYQAPQVKKVKLQVKNAILAVCHSSPLTSDPRSGEVPCAIITACYDPNG